MYSPESTGLKSYPAPQASSNVFFCSLLVIVTEAWIHSYCSTSITYFLSWRFGKRDFLADFLSLATDLHSPPEYWLQRVCRAPLPTPNPNGLFWRYEGRKQLVEFITLSSPLIPEEQPWDLSIQTKPKSI